MSFTVLRYLAQTQPETHISTHSQLLPNQPIFFHSDHRLCQMFQRSPR